MDDDYDEYCDLDITGDPALDQQGYQGPHWPSEVQRHQAQLKRDREQRRNISKALRDSTLARNKAETRQRNRARRGEPEPVASPQPQPVDRAAGGAWTSDRTARSGRRSMSRDQTARA